MIIKHTVSTVKQVEKTADETRTSTNTPADDADLHFTVAAYQNVLIDMIVHVNAHANADFKWTWTYPAGGFMNARVDTTQAVWADTIAGVSGNVATVGSDQYFNLRYYYRGGANAGTIMFQWSANNNVADPCKLRKATRMVIT